MNLSFGFHPGFDPVFVSECVDTWAFDIDKLDILIQKVRNFGGGVFFAILYHLKASPV